MSNELQDHSSIQPTGPAVPLAGPIPNPEGPVGPWPPLPGPIPLPTQPAPAIPDPFPPGPIVQVCNINLREGCYRIGFTPNQQLGSYQGTMRVDKHGGNTVISGDLYWSPPFLIAPRPASPFFPLPTLPYDIPIYARKRYHSYLKVVGVKQSPHLTTGPCYLALTVDQFDYTQPPPGSFNGSFPSSPSRQVVVMLSPKAAPAGFSSSYFSGNVYQGGVDKGNFTMGWVSSFFRKATIEIDTLKGSAAPQPVPGGSGTENIRSTFATAGWDVNVLYDQTNVAVPAGVTATNCWGDAQLHGLMLSCRKATTNLDKEWHMHLVVVPAKLGCGRGVMYDQIGVPREGVASFSDDGYPTSDSLNFGTAANQKQRDVPRAFMRSACHELGHGFNQVHQENEGGSDNSIMTTSPGVANVLGGPTTGAPGVFPTDIALRFNDHVRHHLVHFPDPVVRPGGMTFGTGHASASIPQADIGRYFFEMDELELKLIVDAERVKLGQPLPISWELENKSKVAIPTPSDIGLEAQHAFISLTDPNDRSKMVPSFTIKTDHATIQPLRPGESLSAQTNLLWSSLGFAFTTPGPHTIEVRLLWNYGGLALGVKASAEVFVDYPVSEADNEVAAHLMHDEVGKFVALGGGAPHLTEAVARIERAISAHEDHPACVCLAEFAGHKYSKGRRPARGTGGEELLPGDGRRQTTVKGASTKST